MVDLGSLLEDGAARHLWPHGAAALRGELSSRALIALAFAVSIPEQQYLGLFLRTEEELELAALLGLLEPPQVQAIFSNLAISAAEPGGVLAKTRKPD